MQARSSMPRPRTIHIVSLGCAKNRVDSEFMLGLAVAAGWRPVGSAEQADAIVVNTCTFIGQARDESIDVILEMARLKGKGRTRRLIVVGCLPQRYGEDLAQALPEVDHLIGTADLHRLAEVLAGRAPRVLIGGPGSFLAEASSERLGSGLSSYLKIGDGCSKRCAFCIIPGIKGPCRSRTVRSLVEEARRLADHGVVELCLVAQDLSAFGRDLGERNALERLIERLREVSGIRWIRLLYFYPDRISPGLLRLFSEGRPLLPYLDVPIQHADSRILRRMRRGYGPAFLRRMIETLRSGVPGITLRTTVLVGHPGEDDEAFRNLMAFLEWARFERLGVFRYSAEEGTESFRNAAPSPRIAYLRYRRVRALGRRIQRRANRSLVGRTVEVLVEGADPSAPYLMQGRHPGQAPEVDGVVHLADAIGLAPGDRVLAGVEQAGDDDLIARVIRTTDIGR